MAIQEAADSGLAAACTTCWPTRPQQWDKIIKIGRTHLADATPLRLGQEIRRLRAAAASCRSSGPSGRSKPCWNCRPAARRSARASTRIPSSAAAWPRCWPRKRASRSSRPANHFEANAQRDGLVECHGQLRTIAVDAVQRRQQHSLARQRPALRLLRSQAARPAAGQLDHAGQGQPGDVRKHDAGRRPRDGQRPDGRLQRRDRRPVSAQHHDAGHGADDAGKRRAAGQRDATRSSISAPSRWKPTPKPARPSVEKSLSMVTSLNPHIGYEKAAHLAKEAFKTGKTIRELVPGEEDSARRNAQRSPRPVEHDGAARLSGRVQLLGLCQARALSQP